MKAQPIAGDDQGLPDSLSWLADAPLFIDGNQIGRFYDAVVHPASRQGTIQFELSKEKARDLEGAFQIQAGLTTEKLAALLAPVFSFIKPEVKASGEGKGKSSRRTGSKRVVELLPIDTSERKLELLTLHYVFNHPGRLFLVSDPSKKDWRSPEQITKVPRAMVFLDLPGESATAGQRGLRPCLIPTAAEFTNGHIVQLYKALRFDETDEPPAYPEKAGSLELLRQKRQEYWRWFAEHYSATKAMIAVETAAEANGRIRWIDYRLPVSADGDSLHLHVIGGGEYDTGVFAYNLIKRGYKHGLRLVGTLKSEPDMNVLAIYEK
jgi:hypothetical protein